MSLFYFVLDINLLLLQGPKYMVSETYQRFKGDQPDRSKYMYLFLKSSIYNSDSFLFLSQESELKVFDFLWHEMNIHLACIQHKFKSHIEFILSLLKL